MHEIDLTALDAYRQAVYSLARFRLQEGRAEPEFFANFWDATEDEGQGMEYRRLGRSGVQVSSLCLGTMKFGKHTPDEEAMRIIHAAIDAGINFIDTANVYVHGRSEEIVGKALSQDGKRNNVVLATKVTCPMGDQVNESGSSRYHIMRECEASLRRLRTDRIDLYQLHGMDLSTSLDEYMRALDDLVRQGKVVYIGSANFAPALLAEAIMLSERNGWARFVSEQPPYSLLDRTIDNELIWTCKRHGVGIMAWAPIGAGILSGKYSKDGPQPAGGRFHELNPRLTLRAIEIADAIKPLAEEKGCTPAELSLAWVRQQPGVTAPITGVRTMDQLESSLRSLDVTFTPEELARIDRIAPPGTAASDYYDITVFERLRDTVVHGRNE